MTKKHKLLVLSLLVTIGLFIYLTVHHYAIKLGLGGNALCSLSQTVNCDAAALSSYSEVLGMPVAILGAVFHLILLGFVLFAGLGWIERSPYLRTSIRGMLILSAGVSVVMAFISFAFIKVICPFCVATYVFSLINLALGWKLYPAEKEKVNYANYLTSYRSHLLSFALVPIFAWVASGMIQENYGLNELKKIVPEKIAQWQSGTTYQLDPEMGISNRVPAGKTTLIEFADFKCSHCRDASKTFDTFLKANPDVRMVLKPFPLDGTCNSNDKMGKGDGSRCELAAWALCADKVSQKGWETQKWIFSKFDEFNPIADLKPRLPELIKEFSLDEVGMNACVDSAETYALMRKITEEGSLAQVSGTPTVYLNSKKLGYGHILEVLKTAVNSIK